MQPDQLAKKIKENLLSQKEKLENYLNILEKEESDISSKDPDKLLAHINIENNIIEELMSFKKILEPLEKIYFDSPYKKEDTIYKLKNSLTNLSSKVRTKAENNKKILDSELVKIKAELKKHNSSNIEKKVYTNNYSQFIDING